MVQNKPHSNVSDINQICKVAKKLNAKSIFIENNNGLKATIALTDQAAETLTQTTSQNLKTEKPDDDFTV